MSDMGWTLWAAIQTEISTIDYDFWGWAIAALRTRARDHGRPGLSRPCCGRSRADEREPARRSSSSARIRSSRSAAGSERRRTRASRTPTRWSSPLRPRPGAFRSARVVLLRGLDERGFVFFTNYESRKASDLEAQSARRARAVLGAARPPGSGRRDGRASGTRRSPSRLLHESTAPRAASVPGPRRRAGRSPPVTSSKSFWRRRAALRGRGTAAAPFWGGYRVMPGDDRALAAPRRPPPRPRALHAGSPPAAGASNASRRRRRSS